MSVTAEPQLWEPPSFIASDAVSEELLRRALKELSEDTRRELCMRLQYKERNPKEQVSEKVEKGAKIVWIRLTHHAVARNDFLRLFHFDAKQVSKFPNVNSAVPFEEDVPRSHANNLSELGQKMNMDLSRLDPALKEDLRLIDLKKIRMGGRHLVSTFDEAMRYLHIVGMFPGSGRVKAFNVAFMKALGIADGQKLRASCRRMVAGGKEWRDALVSAEVEMKELVPPEPDADGHRNWQQCREKIVEIYKLLDNGPSLAKRDFCNSLGGPEVAKEIQGWIKEEQVRRYRTATKKKDAVA